MGLSDIARHGSLTLLSLWAAIGSAGARTDDGSTQETGQREALEFIRGLEAESKHYVFRDPEGRVIEVRLGALHASDEALLQVSRISSLTRLLVGCSKRVTPQGLRAIAKLSGLRDLELRGLVFLAPPGFMNDLCHLENLESLDLSYMPLVEGDVKAIAEFPHLKNLRLFDVGLRDTDLPWLRKVKGLVSLDISQNALSDRGLRSLAPPPTSLRKLRAADVTVTEDTRRALEGVEVKGKSL